MMTHLACIMDGNRRWAMQHGLGNVGRDGIDAAYKTVDFCIKRGIPYLSLFAFSLENFKRSPHEISSLFDLMVLEMSLQQDSLIKQGIKVRFIGDQTQFPASIKEPCRALEIATAAGAVVQVNVMICYGARQEIADAATRIVHDIAQGILKTELITADIFERYLWSADVPHPDLIIRTGNVQRLSNFLLYQAAYAELYFLDCLWPAITESHLALACDYFVHCKRNFGQ
jgi:undecaprenyl diphosphate synthase